MLTIDLGPIMAFLSVFWIFFVILACFAIFFGVSFKRKNEVFHVVPMREQKREMPTVEEPSEKETFRWDDDDDDEKDDAKNFKKDKKNNK